MTSGLVVIIRVIDFQNNFVDRRGGTLLPEMAFHESPMGTKGAHLPKLPCTPLSHTFTILNSTKPN